MNMVALIPARAGSKRCPGKNTRLLGGHPLLAWTIAAVQESGVFKSVFCCTDDVTSQSDCTGAIAARYGVGSVTRPPASDDEPDIVWVTQALKLFNDRYEAFAILRPTSPFRTAATIQRAFKQFCRSEVHSIRAVQPVTEHPGKMWMWPGVGYPMTPLIGEAWPSVKGHQPFRTAEDRPWHSLPTQTLPQVYVQNASLEMAWSYVIPSFGTISGTKIAPFFTEGYEGFDVNTEEDFERAAQLVAAGAVRFPAVPVPTPL